MAASAEPFSGPIVGSPPRLLASGAGSLKKQVEKLWALGLELGDKQWLPQWSPNRDELTRSSRDLRYQQSTRARRCSLGRAVKIFQAELDQRRAEAERERQEPTARAASHMDVETAAAGCLASPSL